MRMRTGTAVKCKSFVLGSSPDEGETALSHQQFVGRLVVNLVARAIRFARFRLRCRLRNSNVDINAFSADMVFVPRMELLATDVDDRSEIAWDIFADH